MKRETGILALLIACSAPWNAAEARARGHYHCRKAMRAAPVTRTYGAPFAPGPVGPRTPLPFRFSSRGASIAGQVDRPAIFDRPPVIFLLHGMMRHDRDGRTTSNPKFLLYKWLADYFVSHGFAFFRFDKRGAGKSRRFSPRRGGDDDDYVAGYRYLLQKVRIPARRVVILAQSKGTVWLKKRWSEIRRLGKPAGAILFSNILKPRSALRFDVRLHVVMGEYDDCNDQLARRLAASHNARHKLGSTHFWGRGADHPLFDIRRGDWSWWHPASRLVYHQGALDSMTNFVHDLVAVPDP